MKRYYGTDRDGTEVRVTTGYDLGGSNFLSGTMNRRGYYVYVQPVRRGSREGGIQSVSFGLFEGFKQLLLEVTRQSGKAEAEAEAMAAEIADRLAGQMAAEAGFGLTGDCEEGTF